MNIQLKNVKVCNWASQETTCFDATIYADGKKIGTASNQGTGGSNNYHIPDADMRKAFHAHCKSLPPVPWGDEEWAKDLAPMESDADIVIGDLLAKYEETKQFKRWCKTQTCFRLKGDDLGSYRTVKAKYDPRVKAFIAKKYGDKVEEILNERFI